MQAHLLNLLELISIENASKGRINYFNRLCNEVTRYILSATTSQEGDDNVREELGRIYNPYIEKIPASYKEKIISNAILLVKDCREKFNTEEANQRLKTKIPIFLRLQNDQLSHEQLCESFQITKNKNPLGALRVLYDTEKAVEEEFLTKLAQGIAVTITPQSIDEIAEYISDISKLLEECINDKFSDNASIKQRCNHCIAELCDTFSDHLKGAMKENIDFMPVLQFNSHCSIEVVGFTSDALNIITTPSTIQTVEESVRDSASADDAKSLICETYGRENPTGILPVFGNIMALYIEKIFSANKEDVCVPDLSSLGEILGDLLKPHQQDNQSAPIYLDLQGQSVRANFQYKDENSVKIIKKYAMIFAYLIFPEDRYSQIVYFSGIIKKFENDYYFYDERNIPNNVIQSFSNKLVTLAKYLLLQKLDVSLIVSQQEQLSSIKQELESLKGNYAHNQKVNRHLAESIEQLRILEENLGTFSQYKQSQQQMLEYNYDEQDLRRFIDQNSTSGFIIKEIAPNITTSQAVASDGLTQDDEKLGLRTVNSTIGITILPIKGYKDEKTGIVHGQPQVGGCQLYPIFYQQLSQVFKIMGIVNFQEFSLGCFFNSIRDPLLGAQQHLLLNFLEDYGVKCTSENKDLDIHTGGGNPILFEVTPVANKSMVAPYRQDQHNYGLVIPLQDFLDFLKENFNGQLLEYPDFARAIDETCTNLKHIDNEDVKKINDKIKGLNKKIDDIFQTFPSFLGTDKIEDITSKICKLREQDCAAAIAASEKESAELENLKAKEMEQLRQALEASKNDTSTEGAELAAIIKVSAQEAEKHKSPTANGNLGIDERTNEQDEQEMLDNQLVARLRGDQQWYQNHHSFLDDGMLQIPGILPLNTNNGDSGYSIPQLNNGFNGDNTKTTGGAGTQHASADMPFGTLSAQNSQLSSRRTSAVNHDQSNIDASDNVDPEIVEPVKVKTNESHLSGDQSTSQTTPQTSQVRYKAGTDLTADFNTQDVSPCTSQETLADKQSIQTRQKSHKGLAVGISISCAIDIALLALAFTDQCSYLAKVDVLGLSTLFVVVPIVCAVIGTVIDYFCNKPRTDTKEGNVQQLTSFTSSQISQFLINN